ncbi:MAG: hybrid sensor histidine kinase/response regulator [Pseudomonadota bacterium]
MNMDFLKLATDLSSESGDAESTTHSTQFAGNEPTDRSRGADPISVLLVDDDDVDLESVRRLLRKADDSIQVLCAQDIISAQQKLLSSSIDIVILDYLLPNGDVGSEHISELRELTRDTHLPFIMLTGFGDEKRAAASFKDGASDYLSKKDLTSGAIYRALTNAIDKANLARKLDNHRAIILHTNEQLKQSNEQIRAFYQTVSHELKSPLTGAREYIALVRDGVAGELNSAQKEMLNFSIDCCDSLTTLINDLVDTASIENGKLRLSIASHDMRKIASDCITRYRVAAENKGVLLNMKMVRDIPAVDCDKVRIDQLISNLLSNAIKFTEKSGKIMLSIDADKAMRSVVISVKDTGQGMETDILSSVFDKFVQAKDNAETGHNGMGVGLYLCKSIVDLHGGEIVVHSRINEGSEFRAIIPMKAVRGKDANTSEEETKGSCS